MSSSGNLKTTYQQYQEGELGAQEALTQLIKQYDSIEERLDGWQKQKEALRENIEDLVTTVYAGKAALAGWEMRITEPSVSSSYDAKKLDKLVFKLMKEGQIELAQEIEACRKETNRKAYLRMVRQNSKEAGL